MSLKVLKRRLSDKQLDREGLGQAVYSLSTWISGSGSTGFKSLAEGDEVSFDTEKGLKGLKAVNVI